MPFPVELKPFGILWSVDMVPGEEGRCLCWSSGGGSPVPWFSGTLAQKSSTSRVQGGQA